MFIRYAPRVLILLSLAVLYAALTQKYRAYDIDNPWFLSFSYNACHGGILTDEFEQTRYPNGMDGVHLFGRLAAWTQCSVLNRIGWTPTGVPFLNLSFGLISLALWWSFLRRMGCRERWIAAYIVLLGVSEPMVSMTEKARYEFFAFLLLSSALWLGVQGLELAASLLSMLAVETEPAAFLVPLAVFTLLALRTKNLRLLILKSAMSAVVAAAVYVGLHPGAISEIANAPQVSLAAGKSVWGGTMFVYFFERRRHLPELAMLLIGGWLYWRRRATILDSAGVWLAAVVGTCCIVAPHPNPSYMIFAFPFLLWPALEGYDRVPSWRWIPALVCLAMLAQYGYLYKVNLHEGFTSSDFKLVEDQINQSAKQLHLAKGQLRIIGDYTLWFAHPDHFRALGAPDSLKDANLYLCFDGPLEPKGLSANTSMWCPEIGGKVPVQELSSVDLRGHRLHIFAPR